MSKKIITIVLLVVVSLLTGCSTQTSGGKYNIMGWDQDGPYLARIHTNGIQAEVGKDPETTSQLNAQFNDAAMQRERTREKAATVRKAIKERTITDADGLLKNLNF